MAADARNPRNGLTDAIRAQLTVDVPMHAAEITDALIRAGHDVEEKNVRAILNQREAAGEFRKELLDHKVAFTLNPLHKPAPNAGHRIGSGSARPAKSPAAARVLTVDLERAKRVVDAIDVPAGALLQPSSPPRATPAGDPLRPPLGLGARLEAISQDIEDAITDACDALAPHAVIKALVRAGGEARRAREQLAA